MNTDPSELNQEQIDILYEHKRMREREQEPVLVTQQSVDAVREVLGASLQQRGVADPDSLNLEALAGQFIKMDEEEVTETVTALSNHNQQPETGGAPPAETGSNNSTDPEDAVESLSAEERNEAREKLERASLMAERTPAYADSLRQQAADIVGVDDADEIDFETL